MSRNRFKRYKRKRPREPKTDEELRQEIEVIKSMDDSKSYSVSQDGKPLFSGMFANGKWWKEWFNLNEK